MADRAYLYADDRPDAWDEPEEGYYDSRWTLPLAWFFFFRPENVFLIDVCSHGSRWREVRLSAEKDAALKLFDVRKPLLTSLIGPRLSNAAVDRFVATVGERPGRYILLNPAEVLGGINCGFDDDQGHARRISQILVDLGDGSCSADAIREATGPYVKDLSPDPDKCECQIIGYTYS